VNVHFIKPMECLPAKKLPTGDRWTYEVKLDGFRVQAIRTENRIALYSKQAKSSHQSVHAGRAGTGEPATRYGA
jgi:hypothetical protein